MTIYFFFGSLRHPPLLGAIIGRDVDGVPATLADHALTGHAGGRAPVLVEREGAQAEGILVDGLTTAEAARLDYFRHGTRATLRTVDGPDGPVDALVYLRQRTAGPHPWIYADWCDRWGALMTEATRDMMAGFGDAPPARQDDRLPQILGRADSRLRAAGPRPLRGLPPDDALQVAARRHPYANYFAVEDYDLSFRRFDGTMSETVTRAVFVSGDAVSVLPYDPLRDRVLLVEQFRAGAFARGDSQPWILEPIAGRIDAGETPEAAIRREAHEEAGLDLGPLIEVARYYPSPGAVSEFIYAYLAITDLPDGVARTGGLESEAEDIRGHLMSFDELMALVRSGEGGNAPLAVSAWWLAAHRADLRDAEVRGATRASG